MSRQSAQASSQNTSSGFGRTAARHRKDAGASLKRMLRAPFSSALTILVIATALLLPSILFSMHSNLAFLLAQFENNARVVLYLSADTEDARGMEVSNNLLTYNDISSAEFVSREQALQDFSSASGFSDIVSDLGENPLPSSIVVTPDLESLAGIDRLAENLAAIPEVELVQVDSLWLRRLAAISDLISLAARMLGLIVVLSLCFIVGNSVRMLIENRREEIKIIKLIGGTHSYIARPFLYSGLFYGAFGGVLACLLQALIILCFSDSIGSIAALYSAEFQLPLSTPTNFFILTLSGAFTGWFAAVIAGLRYIGVINP